IRLAVVALILYGGLLALTGKLFVDTPTSFVPPQDKGYLICIVKLPDGASLDRTDAVVREVGDIILAHPAVGSAIGFPGLSINGFSNAPNQGVVFVSLKPFKDRHDPAHYGAVVAGDLQMQLFGIDEALVFCVNPPPILGLGSTGGFKLYLQDRGGLGQ